MQRQDNIITFGSAVPHQKNISLNANGRRISSECRNLVIKAIPKLMNDLFENLDDSLYEMANKSDNNALQNVYFDSMRELRKQRAGIDRAFTQELLSIYDRYWQTGEIHINQPTLDELSRDSEMSLVENDDLEESLAITNMVSKSESRFARELYAMGQRFAFIIGGGNINEQIAQRSPLEPGVVCNAFQFAMSNVPVELPVKLVVYKLFDRHVMHYIGGLYDEVNLLLGRAGVIPKLTPKVRRNPIAPSMRGDAGESYLASDSSYVSTAPPTGYPESQMSSSGSEVQAEVFATLQQLLGTRRASSGSSMLTSSLMLTTPNGNIPVVDTGELLGALSAIQQSNVVMLPQGRRIDKTLTPEEMRTRLVTDLKIAKDGQLTRSLGDADNDTIDVISMLFEFILDDYSLPDAMKALISRLQIPMLKVAIIDKSFFSEKVHPARRLLNSLAQAAVGWNDTGDRVNDTLYTKIESTIKRILNEFHDDPELFAELNDEFSKWWEKEQRGAQIAEKRTNQITKGKEQLKSAKQIVSEELNQRLRTQKLVPQAVMSILEDGWKDALLLIYLREGDQSQDWTDALEIVDRLLWSVQPKSEYGERQQLLRGIPELLRNVRERLNSISFDQHKMARLFKELQNCHIQVLRGGDGGQMNTTGTQPVSQYEIHFPDSQLTSDDNSQLKVMADEAISDSDEFSKMASELEPGMWLEMADGPTKVRVKLSWKSKVTDTYIFVNRKGMKAMELTSAGVAKQLREGRAKMVEVSSTPIMDRALDAMLSALKNTDASSASA
ncbi:MAG: DUF1631 domain-containing protein [Candidatus Thiodiazotropha sp. (ex. Lucinisca nassula)]|nr:DUF1631 domain-containing protein [Candidatus Thiodiazotropha sp. (ex. Lucinisca nassula)]MBW9269940.1 DUF1631 domain-containing protein [Candidatus Thiodiazotropha sp. (ex. Lucinisca nassula)]